MNNKLNAFKILFNVKNNNKKNVNEFNSLKCENIYLVLYPC